MKRISIIYDEDDYVRETAWCRAKGFKGKEPIATAHHFVMMKYKNVAPLTAAELEVYDRELVAEETKMKASQSGTIPPTSN